MSGQACWINDGRAVRFELRPEIVDLFLKTTRELVDDLSTAIASGNGDALHRIAHRLKGTATAVSGTAFEPGGFGVVDHVDDGGFGA